MPCLIWVTAAAFWPISALLSFLSTDFGQNSNWAVLLYTHSDQVIPLLKILQWFPISPRLETKIFSKTYKQQGICPSRHQFTGLIFTLPLSYCSLSSNCLSTWPPRSWNTPAVTLSIGLRAVVFFAWNSLPTPHSYLFFKYLLNSHLPMKVTWLWLLIYNYNPPLLLASFPIHDLHFS